MAPSPNKWEAGPTVLILLLSTLSSLLGLFRDGHYAAHTGSVLRIYAQDAVLLVLGVPVLGIGFFLARRDSLRGRFVWLGSLAFMAYMWIHYAFVVGYNDFFLGYIALLGLSIFTLFSGIIRTDASRVFELLHDDVSTMIYGGVLAVTGIGLAGLWLSELVPALLAGELPSAIVQLGPEAAHTYVVDLGILVPALLVTAVWLRWERPWGYVSAGVLLAFAALIAPTLTAVTVVDLQEGVEISGPLLVGTIIPPLIGLVFAVSYLRKLPTRNNTATGKPNERDNKGTEM